MDFLFLCVNVTAVLCCQVNPLQKAAIVELVNKGPRLFNSRAPRAVTAAVGDGANDAAMLQRANVGVGILGQEGRKAAATSDYAIPSFK